jgi:hypothetical protein
MTLCAFELENMISFVKGISMPAIVFWLFRLLGQCYSGLLFLYENGRMPSPIFIIRAQNTQSFGLVGPQVTIIGQTVSMTFSFLFYLEIMCSKGYH